MGFRDEFRIPSHNFKGSVGVAFSEDSDRFWFARTRRFGRIEQFFQDQPNRGIIARGSWGAAGSWKRELRRRRVFGGPGHI